MKERYGTPVAGDEREVLAGFLDHYRATILQICEGLSRDELIRPMVASGTSLLGMVKHLAYVEAWWFQENIADERPEYPWTEEDMDADFRIEPDETPEQIFEFYHRACARSREILASLSLDDPARGRGRSADYNVRWVVVHMIEETARHAGQADILRELIDGKTGAGYS